MDPQAQILEEVAKVEAEADAAVGTVDIMGLTEEQRDEFKAITSSPIYSQQLGPGGALPLADLRERIAILTAAGVESYEDGPLRLRFSQDLRPGREPSKREPEF